MYARKYHAGALLPVGKKEKQKMSLIKRSLILLAAVICLLSAGCADKNSSSQGEESSSQTESSQTEDSSGSESSSSDSEPAPAKQGDKIKAAAKFFENRSYEFSEKVSGQGADATVTLIKNEGLVCQTTDYGFGKSVIYCKGADTYYFDDVTKAFEKKVGTITTDPTGNIITEVVRKELPPTKTHMNFKDLEKYDCEEYTYTGGTYITVMDFYFDKTTGMLAKYTLTFSVEGKDDEVQTRQVLRMRSGEAIADPHDEIYIRKSYTDFPALSETEREEFCKALLKKYGVKDEELYAAGLSTFDLKTIKYDDLSTFFIGYAAEHPQQVKEESKQNSKNKKDK